MEIKAFVTLEKNSLIEKSLGKHFDDVSVRSSEHDFKNYILRTFTISLSKSSFFMRYSLNQTEIKAVIKLVCNVYNLNLNNVKDIRYSNYRILSDTLYFEVTA